MPSHKKSGQVRRSHWMATDGPEGEIVLSSRVRLARNIIDLPFPFLASDHQAESVTSQVKESGAAAAERMGNLQFLRIQDISLLTRQVLVEKHLISPLLMKEPRNSSVFLREDEAISIMVNEEDHIRIQCLLPGLQLDRALAEAGRYDDILEEKLDYAYDEQWGYLTACPTNVGTGLRASVMVHLPALVLTKQINRVLAAIAQVGLAVRGLYGEGSEIAGNLVQISNQITLGQSEDEIVRNLYGVTRQIIEQETQARQILLNESRDGISDRVHRAMGLLKYARLMSSQEALQLLSDVRLGIDLGLLCEVKGILLKELMVMLRPACLQTETGRELSGMDRDRERARLIRQRLEDYTIKTACKEE